MRSFNKSAAVLIGCLVLALVALAPPSTRGDEWNLATKFSVNHSFEVPGLVLQADTPYTIRILDSPGTRNVVQIWNEDQTNMLTMFMAISAERREATDDTLFTFIETEPQHPLPIKEWFYPGRLIGREFVYPKDQAMEIARHAREPILAADGDLSDLNTIEVEAIGPIRDRGPVQTAANITKTETTEVFEEKPAVVEESTPVEPEPEADPAEIAEQPELPTEESEIAQLEPEVQPEVQQEEPAPAVVQEEQAVEDREERELPATAGELPLIALIGVLCLGAGLGLKVLSAKS